MRKRIKRDEFVEHVANINGGKKYEPKAWALGYAVYHAGHVVSVHFLHINHKANYGSASVFGHASAPVLAGGARLLSSRVLKRVLKYDFASFLKEPGHVNIDNAREILKRCRVKLSYGRTRVPIVAIIEDSTAIAGDIGDAFLRLEMEARLMIVPNQFEFDKIFAQLPIVAHTNHGPFYGEDPELLEELREEMARKGDFLQIGSLDKFPRLVDHVIPKGVRIADTVRVRHGAHLASGTTVMQSGFVNFNAGTLGASMVEGSVSQGTTVQAGSDVGRGAGFIGSLSGGGKGHNTIGEGSLLGALSEVDISIGNNVLVAMGVQISSTTPVWLVEEKEWVKASEIAGRPNLLIRRSSKSGTIEVIDFGPDRKAVELNKDLHEFAETA